MMLFVEVVLMNNSSGSRQFMKYESTADMMAAYVALPRIVRDLYKYTVADYALKRRSKEVANAIKTGRFTALKCAVQINASLKEHEAEECFRTYGPDHPQADAYGRRLRPNQIAVWGKSNAR